MAKKEVEQRQQRGIDLILQGCKLLGWTVVTMVSEQAPSDEHHGLLIGESDFLDAHFELHTEQKTG